MIFISRKRVESGVIKNYEDLADARWKGKVCLRPLDHMYNVGLLASMISHRGTAYAKNWFKDMVSNLATTPSGGDRDQIKKYSRWSVRRHLSKQLLPGKNSVSSQTVLMGT